MRHKCQVLIWRDNLVRGRLRPVKGYADPERSHREAIPGLGKPSGVVARVTRGKVSVDSLVWAGRCESLLSAGMPTLLPRRLKGRATPQGNLALDR
jgi:hypothetical protein